VCSSSWRLIARRRVDVLQHTTIHHLPRLTAAVWAPQRGYMIQTLCLVIVNKTFSRPRPRLFTQNQSFGRELQTTVHQRTSLARSCICEIRSVTKMPICYASDAYFMLKMHQNSFSAEAPPRGPRWGSLRRSPRLPVGCGRDTCRATHSFPLPSTPRHRHLD